MYDLVIADFSARLKPDYRVREHLWLGIRDGVVAHFGEGPPEGYESAEMILGGGFLLEPFYDAHVHLFLTGSFDASERQRVSALPREEKVERALLLLEEYRRLGVFAVRDGGDPEGIALEAARVANADPGKYAAVRCSGQPLFRRGLYGGFLGEGVENVEGAFRLMERNRAEGATVAKILATGINSLEKAGEVGERQFTPGELNDIARFARSLGLGIMVHANGPSGWVVEAGPDSLEHGFWMADDDLDRLAGTETVWTPTFGAWSSLAEYPGLSEKSAEVVRATAGRHESLLLRAASLGVKVAAGSDAGTPGVPHLKGLFCEVALLALGGLGWAGALAASQEGARKLCGAEEAGLRQGMRGGFVRYAADPFTNHEAFGNPLGAYLGGSTPKGEEKC